MLSLCTRLSSMSLAIWALQLWYGEYLLSSSPFYIRKAETFVHDDKAGTWECPLQPWEPILLTKTSCCTWQKPSSLRRDVPWLDWTVVHTLAWGAVQPSGSVNFIAQSSVFLTLLFKGGLLFKPRTLGAYSQTPTLSRHQWLWATDLSSESCPVTGAIWCWTNYLTFT